MWNYERRLQYPVNITSPNAKIAQIILSQYGGPDGEAAASFRYLSQRYSMPDRKVAGLLTDIGTEELAHLEMVASIVRQLTKGLSAEELEEAATIDGCGSFRLFFSIVIPLMRTILITVAVLNVMWIWNDYLLPSLIINKPGWQTLPLKTYLFFGQFAKRWDLASAGLIMCIIPIIIFYLCCQKYIVKGITDGAIK